MMEESILNEPQQAPAAGPSEPPLTKSAAKRLARRALYESTKLARRASEKDRRKANAARLKADMASGALSPEEMAEAKAKRARQSLKRKLHQGKNKNGGTVVPLDGPGSFKGGLIVDLEFDELMTSAEIQSMSTQLGYVYNSNRKSSRPFRKVVMTGLKEGTALRKRLDEDLRGQYKAWKGIQFLEENVEELAKPEQSAASEPGPSSAPSGDSGSDDLPSEPSGNTSLTDPPSKPANASSLPSTSDDTNSISKADSKPNLNPFPNTSYVYLSADSADEITELREDETYVIGGIVDRNRYKNLCQNKADQMGMRTARLPIGTYLANMPTRKVLTVNQVFDILLKYNEQGSWETALQEVMPQRKFQDGKKERRVAGRSAEGAAGGDEHGDDEDEEQGHSDGMGEVSADEGDDISDDENGEGAGRAGNDVDMEAEAEELMNG